VETRVLQVVRDALRRHAFLAGGETILVAVSGGADSSALLYMLTRLAPQWGLRLHVLHVDHGLRDDSARDAAMVVGLAQRLGVPADVVRVEVQGGGSLEEAARRARYGALEAAAGRLGAHRIAVGHTADDQAETVVMRILTGSGLRGLAGIPAARGRIIRPLLDLRRYEVERVLSEAGLGWVEDATNRDPRFLRNRIRHHVLPLLAAAYHGDVVGDLGRVAARARRTVEALDAFAVAELERLAVGNDDSLTLPRARLAALPPTVAAEVLRLAAARLGRQAPLRAWAYRGLARVLGPPPPRPFSLGAVRIEVSGRFVLVARRPISRLPVRTLPVPGILALPEAAASLESRVLAAAGYEVPRDPRCAAFDAGRLARSLVVRGRRPGDRVVPFGGGGERRLKTLLIDAKVPRWERDRLPLVEAGGEIVWVAGVRRGAQAVVGPTTQRILELRLKPWSTGVPAK
jgi:tRNA(Ile)-lysidine synthase